MINFWKEYWPLHVSFLKLYNISYPTFCIVCYQGILSRGLGGNIPPSKLSMMRFHLTSKRVWTIVNVVLYEATTICDCTGCSLPRYSCLNSNCLYTSTIGIIKHVGDYTSLHWVRIQINKLSLTITTLAHIYTICKFKWHKRTGYIQSCGCTTCIVDILGRVWNIITI